MANKISTILAGATAALALFAVSAPASAGYYIPGQVIYQQPTIYYGPQVYAPPVYVPPSYVPTPSCSLVETPYGPQQACGYN